MHLLSRTKGSWKYQQTIYNIKTKEITNYKNSINIANLEKSNLQNFNTYKIYYDNYKFFIDIIYNEESQKVDKSYNNKNFSYTLKIGQKNQVVLYYKNRKIIFEELIHVINSNFFFIIGILKTHDKYLYISVTSYIKILY